MTNDCNGCPDDNQDACCHTVIVTGDEVSIAAEIAHRQMLSRQVDAQIIKKAPLAYPLLVLGGDK